MRRREFLRTVATSTLLGRIAKSQPCCDTPRFTLPTGHQPTQLHAQSLQLFTVGDYAHVTSADQFDVYVDPRFGRPGWVLANNVAGRLLGEDTLRREDGFFGNIGYNGKPKIMIARNGTRADGSGGAYHTTCLSNQVFVDACLNQPRNYPGGPVDLVGRCCALVMAELSEVQMGVAATIPTRPQSWNCGWSNGESLSRFFANYWFPGTLNDYWSAGTWLSPGFGTFLPTRQDWVNWTTETDVNGWANGCGVLFINWLHTVKGFNPGRIAWCGQNVLAEVYAMLTGEPRSNAWPKFIADVQARWPVGKLYLNVSDNPW